MKLTVAWNGSVTFTLQICRDVISQVQEKSTIRQLIGCSSRRSMKDSSAWNSPRLVSMSRRRRHRWRSLMLKPPTEADPSPIGRRLRLLIECVTKAPGLPLLAAALAVGLFFSSAPAQSLLEKRCRVDNEAEVLLELKAAAPHTSWVEAGSEAAVATVFVDGQYNQDIFLFAGERAFCYPVLIGRFQPGEHTLRVDFNRKRSASKAATVEIQTSTISFVDRSNPEYQALSLPPIVHARPNTIGRFSDIPLLMWYETERRGSQTTILYSIIF